MVVADEPWPSSRVRQTFLDFFSAHGHKLVKSSPVVPHDDPTLLFANAGMNQFKPLFLGQADPNGPLANLERATNTQKCIRAGGKHNDLEDVGKDTYHHTFFEMLGSWSFGSYFKAEAIEMAYTLLTSEYKLPPEQLYASYFGGDATLGMPADTEARDLWLRHLPASRVLPFDAKDNFWEMGDVGPCGPCSELHFDRIGGRDAASLVNADDPAVIEIWNLVFIQYSREADGQLSALPAKHVDTGMGFERLTSILQNKSSNYDTDVFTPIFDAIQAGTTARPYAGLLGAEDKDGVDMAYRVVADHVRTLSFAIADGALPSSEGRGYVLRRILRRAVRYGSQFLGGGDGFFARLVPAVVDLMGATFPELVDKRELVISVIADEESTFSSTLARGIERFNKTVEDLKANGKTVVSGAEAFFLYDTMGFPVDLTARMAEEVGLTVDEAGYHAALEAARAVSRANHAARRAIGGDGASLVLEAEQTSTLAGRGVVPTDDSAKFEIDSQPTAHVRAIYTPNGFVEELSSPAGEAEATAAGVVLDVTSFYAEAGGQVADSGVLSLPGGGDFDVLDVQVYAGFVLHLGRLAAGGSLTVGDTVTCGVDWARRRRIAPNHTMTHVLNHALWRVLGDGVAQKGSLVDEDKLRFDFSFNKKDLPLGDVADVEERVKAAIAEAIPVYSEVAPLDTARGIRALRAVFGETYPNLVRVVSIGKPVAELLVNPDDEANDGLSIEFCGGTHLANTSEAGSFVIYETPSIAKGIRRVSALTGDPAVAAVAAADAMVARMDAAHALTGDALVTELAAVQAALGTATLPLIARRTTVQAALERLLAVAKAAAKEAEKRAVDGAVAAGEAAASAARDAGRSYLVSRLDALGGDGKLVAKATLSVRACLPSGSVLLVSYDPKKGRVVVSAGGSALSAKEWVAAAVGAVGGKGGGKADSAQGQAKVSEEAEVDKVVAAAEAFAAQ